MYSGFCGPVGVIVSWSPTLTGAVNSFVWSKYDEDQHFWRNGSQLENWLLFCVRDEMLPQVEEFQYLRVLFMGDREKGHMIDNWIGEASAVLRTLYWSFVMKKEQNCKAKLSIYLSVYVPLTYGHKLWVVTERRIWLKQVVERSFLHSIAGPSLRGRVSCPGKTVFSISAGARLSGLGI